MTDRQPPEEHPFAQFFRTPAAADDGIDDQQPTSPRRAARAPQPLPETTQSFDPAPNDTQPVSRRAAREAERAGTGQSGEQAPSAPPVDPAYAQADPGYAPVPTRRVPASVGAQSASAAGSVWAETPPQSPPPPFDDHHDLFDFGHAPEPPRRRRRRGLVAVIVILAMFVVLGGVGTALFVSFQPQIEALINRNQPSDYDGAGTGQVNFVINSGDSGESIGDNLEAAGIIKSSSTFYQLLLKTSPAPDFQPGTYSMASQMSSAAALSSLTDGAHLVQNTITIPEGEAAADVLTDLASITGMPLDQFQAAAADYVSLGVPAEAPSIEGFLFPATYDFQPEDTPQTILQTMVNRTFQSLDAAGVAPADRFRVITLASIVQKEARIADDFPKVSRVFLNRIADGMLLQSDATVAYGTGNTHTVDTTSAERDDASNLYNTYVHEGLPVGPISNPGDVAIDAAIHPADGTWLYFVTWNLDTGETIFSTTLAEHEAAVEKWQQWEKDNGQ